MLKLSFKLISSIFFLLIAPYLSAQNTIFCDIIEKANSGNFLEALEQLECYRSQNGEDTIFEALVGYIAQSIDQDALCIMIENGTAETWGKLFLKLAQEKTKESIELQNKSELIARMLITDQPCNPDYFNLFNDSAKVFENNPTVDWIAIGRGYKNILKFNSYDCEDWANMAHAARKAGWIDCASHLYRKYFACCEGTSSQFLDYSRALEDQYNITLSLYFNELYGSSVGYDTLYWERRAHILTYVNLAEHAYPILAHLVQEDPLNGINWAVYSQAAATINNRYESLYALSKAECLIPGDIETHWAEWLALPPVMSQFIGSGSYYHESTTLTNVVENGNFYGFIDIDTKYILGGEGFQTSARPKIITVGGIGRLVGPEGQETSEVETGWLGIEKLFDPKLLANFRLGAARSYVSGPFNQWCPVYILNLDSRQSDCLNLRYFSTYNFYQISPRASSFNLRRWRHQIDIDWRPNYDTQFLTTIDWRAITDGNKQTEVFFFPRRNIYYLEHWKVTAGLMGNWISSRKDPIHGYYAPQLYQVYAAQALIEHRLNRHSSIKASAAAGTQKDNFSTFFGPFTQINLDCLLAFTINWQLRLFGDYYYINQSGGSFNYLKFLGEITYRF